MRINFILIYIFELALQLMRRHALAQFGIARLVVCGRRRMREKEKNVREEKIMSRFSCIFMISFRARIAVSGSAGMLQGPATSTSTPTIGFPSGEKWKCNANDAGFYGVVEQTRGKKRLQWHN